ncbi:M48 family metallopeptidase [Aestuariibacter halophilus]|uniref:M48 family metallopeptidase n=1 Tax=Fluctibacter halophilus TaxID=226011 RepID=A0ABS8GCC0_9ALTE|nr:M48 family metallopeptidase [Aestuariibacter halophilus]MCC2618049.1 M48 family metallopeptidase [Aestuariibacter halophilus]
MKSLRFSALALTCCLFIQGCATSPTGRSQLKLFSKDQLANMGSQAFDSMKSEQPIAKQTVQNSYVECVARAITAQVNPSVFSGEWEVVVFEDDQVNAFALPGGKIGVYTGLLNVAKNEHQLAAVLGHEVGHVIAEHGNERMSNSALIGIGLEATNALLQSNEVSHSSSIMAAIGLGVQVGVQLPFSRTHESEADLIGLTLMAQAGFDPRESVALWHNMAAANQRSQPEFLSTHPAPDTRITQLQKNMPAALNMQQKSPHRPVCKAK